MKKTFFPHLCVFIFLVIINSHSFAQWSQIGPSQVTYASSVNVGTAGIFTAQSGTEGIYKSTNGGLNWTHYSNINPEWEFRGIHDIHSVGNTIVAGLSGWGVAYTNNGGSNWYHTFGKARPVYTFYTSGTRVFLGTNDVGVFYTNTNSGGLGWTPVEITPDWYNVYCYTGDSALLYVGTENRGIFKSTNNGSNWTATSFTGFNGAVKTMTTIGSRVFAGHSSNISISTNAGANWSVIYTFGVSVNSLVSYNNTLFAGTAGNGIFASTNFGTNWINVSGNLGAAFHAGKLQVYGAELFASTSTLSVIKAQISNLVGLTSHSTELPENFSLYQNYPNPFNPSTAINFDIPKTGNVKLEIFDLSGKLIEELLNEEKGAGTYSVNFNAENLSSGIYVYKLTGTKFSQSRKMMLIK